METVEGLGGIWLVTADHGNVEEMVQRDKKGNVLMEDGRPVPLTSHTLNPVCPSLFAFTLAIKSLSCSLLEASSRTTLRSWLWPGSTLQFTFSIQTTLLFQSPQLLGRWISEYPWQLTLTALPNISILGLTEKGWCRRCIKSQIADKTPA